MEYVLNGTARQSAVYLAFIFTSGSLVEYEGIAIDDVEVIPGMSYFK
jgi:hypothetical protein